MPLGIGLYLRRASPQPAAAAPAKTATAPWGSRSPWGRHTCRRLLPSGGGEQVPVVSGDLQGGLQCTQGEVLGPGGRRCRGKKGRA